MLSKWTQTTALTWKYYAFKGPPTATVMCKYHPFERTPPQSPMSK